MTQVVTLKVTEADSHLILRVNMLSEGSGELENFPILRPSDLIPRRPDNRAAFRLMQIWWGLVTYDLTFKVGTITPTVLWTIAGAADSHSDFRSFGGLVDQTVYTSPPGATDGILTISTNGFALAGSHGSFVIELRKTSE